MRKPPHLTKQSSYRPQQGTAIEKQKHKKQLKQTAVEHARRVDTLLINCKIVFFLKFGL